MKSKRHNVIFAVYIILSVVTMGMLYSSNQQPDFASDIRSDGTVGRVVEIRWIEAQRSFLIVSRDPFKSYNSQSYVVPWLQDKVDADNKKSDVVTYEYMVRVPDSSALKKNKAYVGTEPWVHFSGISRVRGAAFSAKYLTVCVPTDQ